MDGIIRTDNNDFLEKQIERNIVKRHHFWFEIALEPHKLSELNIEDLYNFANDQIVDTMPNIWNASICVFGPRRTGKSFLIRDLLIQLNKYIGRICVITSTEQNDFWKILIPDVCIYPVEMANEVLLRIANDQKKLIKELRRGKKPRLNVLQYTIIFDDFAFDEKFSRYSDTFKKAYTTFRHFGCTIILLSQYPTSVSNKIRGNSDFIFIVKAKGKPSKQIIADDNMDFMDNKAAKELLIEGTKEYNVLCINNNPTINNENEIITRYKATITKSIKLGDKKWREIMDKKKTNDDDENNKLTNVEILRGIVKLYYQSLGGLYFNR